MTRRPRPPCACDAYPFPHRRDSNWWRLCRDEGAERAEYEDGNDRPSDHEFLDFERANRRFSWR